MIGHIPRCRPPRSHLHGAFGGDAFGRRAEGFARWFGTPEFLIGQTVGVALWIVVNVLAVTRQWDPYPFILLNPAFSLQAAHAAPLILLDQTCQADRDRAMSEAHAQHREDLARVSFEHLERLESMLAADQALAGEVRRLAAALEARVTGGEGDG